MTRSKQSKRRHKQQAVGSVQEHLPARPRPRPSGPPARPCPARTAPHQAEAQAPLRPVSEQALLDSFSHQARFHGLAMRYVGGPLKQGTPQKKEMPS